MPAPGTDRAACDQAWLADAPALWMATTKNWDDGDLWGGYAPQAQWGSECVRIPRAQGCCSPGVLQGSPGQGLRREWEARLVQSSSLP